MRSRRSSPIVVDKPGLDVACGAIGIGEITSIPTALRPSPTPISGFDGERRTKLPLARHAVRKEGDEPWPI